MLIVIFYDYEKLILYNFKKIKANVELTEILQDEKCLGIKGAFCKKLFHNLCISF